MEKNNEPNTEYRIIKKLLSSIKKILLFKIIFIHVIIRLNGIKKDISPIDWKKRSEESIAKQLNSRKGYRHSKKTKAKMSKSQSGKNHPFWGKKHSVKTKKKMSEWQLGKPKPWLKGRIPWNKK